MLCVENNLENVYEGPEEAVERLFNIPGGEAGMVQAGLTPIPDSHETRLVYMPVHNEGCLGPTHSISFLPTKPVSHRKAQNH